MPQVISMYMVDKSYGNHHSLLQHKFDSFSALALSSAESIVLGVMILHGCEIRLMVDFVIDGADCGEFLSCPPMSPTVHLYPSLPLPSFLISGKYK